MSCRIDTIPNRDCPPTILLRRHRREGKRVRKETVANPAGHPEWLVEGIRALAGARTFRPEGGGPLGSAGRFRTAMLRRSPAP